MKFGQNCYYESVVLTDDGYYILVDRAKFRPGILRVMCDDCNRLETITGEEWTIEVYLTECGYQYYRFLQKPR